MYLEELFRAWCQGEGLSILETRTIPHGEQFLVSDGTSRIPVNLYATGRGLAQGQPSGLRDRVTEWLLAHATPSPAAKQKKAARPAPQFPERIGIDESGKGDYFGPLVVCAAFASAGDDGWLAEIGVTDSKKLEDRALLKLAAQIRQAVPHETIVLSPAKYNEMHARIRNLNRMLAWGHARALETLLAVAPARAAISDQFGDRSYLENALMERGRTIELVQMPRAEQDMAVAAASVLARAEFLRRMERMSEEYEMVFTKGASDHVDAEARRFVKMYGGDRLGEVAKLHFKNTLRVL
jgi:ribonuclease HIII